MTELKIGEIVIYGSEGVCRVEDKRSEDFGSGARDYYILRTAGEGAGTTFYIPSDNELLLGRVRKILTRDEICELINRVSDEPDEEWTEDNKERTSKFRSMLEHGSRADCIKLIRMINKRRLSLTEHGKRLYMTDENTQKRAEKMLFDEFSTAFEIKPEDLLRMLDGEIFPEKCV